MSANVDFGDLKKFARKLEKLTPEQINQFNETALKELAARLLAKVIKRTPVGIYRGDAYTTKTGKQRYRKFKTVNFTTKDSKEVSFKANVSGKNGGTLRRGWTIGEVTKENETYSIEIINPVEYAPYVEYGHRTRNGGWVSGRFMLTISEKELREDAPRILENKLDKFLGEFFNA